MYKASNHEPSASPLLSTSWAVTAFGKPLSGLALYDSRLPQPQVSAGESFSDFLEEVRSTLFKNNNTGPGEEEVGLLPYCQGTEEGTVLSPSSNKPLARVLTVINS